MRNKNKKIINGGGYCYFKQPAFARSENVSATKTRYNYGFINMKVVLIVLFAFMGGAYLYFVNGSAVKGYQIKSIEKEINALKKENEKLKIDEAELNSLQHIEEASKNFINMAQSDQIVYIEEDGPMALR